ncbi:MAG: cytochrome c class I [Chitinophagia bacterium]|jgi:cytochrome c|nr:cytochrome c class I [Chitinophagia bacterium]NCA29274.1 cytochrome c class I [Chitinophagia bacterium]NDD15486.1 cytochrome c class I [Chitinophagia bacterium]
MKKVLFILSTAVIVMACGGGSTEAGKSTTETKEATASSGNALSDNPDYQKGLALVAGSDCLTCHKTSEKNIGPAYKDVAAKYDNTDANVKMLAEKVIKGGSGNWGAIPMTPHPQLKQEDVEQMIKYILLLKK